MQSEQEEAQDLRPVLADVGAALRSSPLCNNVALYIDRRGRIQIVLRALGRGALPPQQHAVVFALVDRLVMEAYALRAL